MYEVTWTFDKCDVSGELVEEESARLRFDTLENAIACFEELKKEGMFNFIKITVVLNEWNSEDKNTYDEIYKLNKKNGELYIANDDCYLTKETSNKLIKTMSVELKREVSFVEVQNIINDNGLFISEEELNPSFNDYKDPSLYPFQHTYKNYCLSKKSDIYNKLDCYILYPDSEGIVYKKYVR